eukprot:2881006-Rhodomonas_salina.2
MSGTDLAYGAPSKANSLLALVNSSTAILSLQPRVVPACTGRRSDLRPPVGGKRGSTYCPTSLRTRCAIPGTDNVRGCHQWVTMCS